MSSYIQVGHHYPDKKWWNEIIRSCAVIGDVFEIHCWSDEPAEAKAALRFGHKVTSTWRDGVVIRGRITKEFLAYLMESPKPEDIDIYNKMTPFFTIIFGNTLHSEHYGTEIIISRVIRERVRTVDRILDQMENVAIVHRNIHCH